jgi:hypothetical protein
MSDLDDDLRRIGVDPARLDPAVRDALRSARPEPDPEGHRVSNRPDDEVHTWLRGLFGDPDPPPAPTDEPAAPTGNRVRREGNHPEVQRVDERTKFVRELFGLEGETGWYRQSY